VVATLIGCFFAWSLWVAEAVNYFTGVFGPDIRTSDNTIVVISRLLFDYAWFVGFGISFLVHWLLMKGVSREAAEV
jgi:cytosine/uracil/thiamine/allantoin permease